jgi:hypothetical protein
MEQFTLRDLLLFLLVQKKYDYRGITVLMEILEANKLSPERMKFTMLAGFHACDLYEVGHPKHDDRFSEDEYNDEDKYEDDIEELREHLRAIPGQYQRFPCQVMNARVHFTSCLN